MKERDYQMDNLKGMLVFLVVFGHLIQFTIWKTAPIVGYTYTGIYLFHMPLFVFISGYFSKKSNAKRLLELFIVYALWQMLITPVFVSLTTDSTYSDVVDSIFKPYAHHWYLVSLIIWRIMTPYVSSIKKIILISFICGIGIGLSSVLLELSPSTKDVSTFSFGRTIGFYPFFLMGYFFTKEKLDQIKKKLTKPLGIISFLSLVIVGVIFLNSQVDHYLKHTMINKMLFMREAYAAFLTHPSRGILMRIILYLIQLGLVLLPFSFISSKKSIWSQIGMNSFFIYLSHGIFYLALQKIFFAKIDHFLAHHVLMISAIVAMGYCLLLCTKPFVRLGSFLTSPKVDGWFKLDR